MSEFKKCNLTKLQLFLGKFNELVKHPEIFLSCQQKESEKIKTFLQNLYDYINSQDKNTIVDILPKLIIDDLDEEQIWQQIEIKNDSIWLKFLETTSKLLSIPNKSLYIQYKPVNDLKESDNQTEEDDENSYMGSDDNSNNFDQDSDKYLDISECNEDIYKIPKNNKIKINPSIVDDKFFKLSELEAFLNSEDKKELSKYKKSTQSKNTESAEIDYFATKSSEDESSVNYNDFFEGGNNKEKALNNTIGNEKNVSHEEGEVDENIESNEKIHNRNSNLLNYDSEYDDNDNDSDANDNEDDGKMIKSSHEQFQDRLRQRIDEYEDKALGEKPWQLKGEIAATSRPQNSLLEDILEYDASTRPPPVITEELNQTIEDIIRQRIKDKAWDDVVRIEKPLTTPQELRKKLILDPEKNKQSLAQIYEKEYQKEIEKLSSTDKTEKEAHFHKEITEMMSSLFNKLDALSNFHFIPKHVVPEPKIITNTPVIKMEEVAPVSISNAKLLAPEEIKVRSKGNVLGASERTKNDKARERRHKKNRQKSIFKTKEINTLQNQNTKIKNDKLLKDVIKIRNVSQISGTSSSFKSSKSFFSQLQDKTTTKEMKRKPTRKGDNELSVKKLKL